MDPYGRKVEMTMNTTLFEKLKGAKEWMNYFPRKSN